jgi:outer membrane protein OmpA-like peptidoglycan-associated protein
MPGSLGQSDIFVVDVNEDGSLGTPENLGPSINTEGQESFPFLNTNGDLFYASTGLPGLGGLDVFKSEALDNKRSGVNRYFTVENVGKPVNSSSDDFAYYESYQSQQVYFSSNRSGGKGSDDIYSFAIPDCQQLVRGVVKDKATAALLSNASVLLLDGNGNELSRKAIGSDGRFEFTLDCEKTYLVRGEKESYTADEKRFTTPNKTQDLELELLLGKEAIMLNPCDDLAKLLDIPMIYFDFDKFNIRYDAEIELQKVLAVLQKYPTMTIAIRSHTDCRGTAAYNERLSDQRAQSTRAYLIKNGIAAERLTAKGYGESQLLNACGCEPTNQSDCSEAEHQKNRRSEFIITSLNGKTCDDN